MTRYLPFIDVYLLIQSKFCPAEVASGLRQLTHLADAVFLDVPVKVCKATYPLAACTYPKY
jgi:hypothetical protein